MRKLLNWMLTADEHGDSPTQLPVCQATNPTRRRALLSAAPIEISPARYKDPGRQTKGRNSIKETTRGVSPRTL